MVSFLPSKTRSNIHLPNIGLVIAMTSLLLIGLIMVTGSSPAPVDSPSSEEVGPAPFEPTIVHLDYLGAVNAAVEQHRMLLICFSAGAKSHSPGSVLDWVRGSLLPADTEILKRDYVLAELPTSTQIKVNGRAVRLLDDPSFTEMLHTSGIAIIDFASTKAELYGRVVSTFPLTNGRYYKQPDIHAVLRLPHGTLTQRSLIYAVRVHPEMPASTKGEFNPVLAQEAHNHSVYQASVQTQGHQGWDARSQGINSQLHALSQEVAAESWPNEHLMEACLDCVASWRQSPGHWSAVMGRRARYGYDIQQGKNGIWYATGIFTDR